MLCREGQSMDFQGSRKMHYNENIALRTQLEKAMTTNNFLYQQAGVHVAGLSQSEQAVRDELACVSGIAEQEQMRTSPELAREIAERENIGKNVIDFIEIHISRRCCQIFHWAC